MTENLPAPRQPSILAKVADKFSMTGGNLLSTLTDTIFPNKKASPEQVQALLIVADQYNLNPFTKEIYAFPGKGGGVMPVVSVDGWLKMANEHPMFDGMDIAFKDDAEGKPISCTCTIHRKDRSHPTVIEEYYSENRRMTDPWKMNPHRMLRHRAVIQCIRTAFSFAGIHLADEIEQVSEPTPAQHTEAVNALAAGVMEVPVVREVEVTPEPAATISSETEAAADALFGEDADWVD